MSVDVKEIADGVTDAQRKALVKGSWNVWPISRQLIAAGIARQCEERHFMVELTPLGVAVRNLLLSEKADHV